MNAPTTEYPTLDATIDPILADLVTVENEIKRLQDAASDLRHTLQDALDEAEVSQLDTQRGRLSVVERRTVRITNERAAIEAARTYPAYLRIVPEHEELSDEFQRDAKTGLFTIPGVDLTVTRSLRFEPAKASVPAAEMVAAR